MNSKLSQLSDQVLVDRLKGLIQNERKVLTAILEHLLEVEVRKLFLDYGYSSIYEFAAKHLGYSEPAAHRRISAMRLIKVLPEVKEKLEGGALSLTVVAQAQSFFVQEKKQSERVYSAQEKREVLELLEGKSKKETEKELIKLSPHAARPKERIRRLSETESEVTFIASDALLEKVNRFKELTSHKNSQACFSELFDQMAEIVLNKIDPLRKKTLNKKSMNTQEENTQNPRLATPTPPAETESSSNNPRYVPSKIKNFLWHRDQGKCSFIDSASQRKCGSQYFVQLDHITPVAFGGKSTIQNLRLLCAGQNQNQWRKSRTFPAFQAIHD